MPRPRLHATEDLLDAAAGLAAEHGPAGVTMGAVAAASGAPSGTLYHRFGSRAGLLAGVWLRTVEAFQAGYLERLARDPVLEGCVAAARHVVAWTRSHPQEVQILLRGPRDFAVAGAPADLRERIAATDTRLEAAIAAAAARLPLADAAEARELVVFATVDLPYAAARRHLRRGTMPPGLEEHLARAVRAVLVDRLGPGATAAP